MKKNILLIVVVLLILSSIYYLEGVKPGRYQTSDDSVAVANETDHVADAVTLEQKAKMYSFAREITDPSGYLNTNGEPITLSQFVGNKIVLLDIWTYSCINCQRTLPYINAWYDKYQNYGLEIIGIHSPEFEFEKDINNVREATERFGVRHPVVLDNDFGTWRAYGNRYWPRKYLIDIDGFVTYDHIGEGDYDATEMKIQALLKERAARLGLDPSVIPGGVVEPSDVITRSEGKISPEVYFGSKRNFTLANGSPGQIGVQTFSRPATVETDALYLTGEWDIQPEFAKSTSAGSTILYRYQAKDVYMVLSGPPGAGSVDVLVKIDGKVITPAMAGADVNENGMVTVSKERLYKLVADDNNLTPHTLELEAQDAGLNAFTFTFG
ncbi:redoxin domain-containing protein [Candidatus Peregrinibacteria bacterium]|nr:MAG: redoxin domain-containing protein [Candidatus Peregrinibacteria bacterium]